jgi:hypothetical protein
MIVMGFDDDILCSGTRDFTVQVVEVCIFFEIETWDVAVQESMMMREMAVKLVEEVDDWGEIPINTTSRGTEC